jgi:hypothetical protein
MSHARFAGHGLLHNLTLVAIVMFCIGGMPALAQDGAWISSLQELKVNPSAIVRKGAPNIKVYLDRVVYTEGDRDGQGLAVVNPSALLREGKLAGHSVELQMADGGGKLLGAPTRITLKMSDHVGFDLNMPAIPPGDYQVKATLFSPAGAALSSGVVGYTKKAGRPTFAASLKAPLRLFRLETSRARGVPISTGIPLPEGLLQKPENVRLLENGKEIPCQTSVRSRWSRRGSIRWLGVDFQADYPGGLPRSYELAFGRAGTAKPKKPLELQETPESFVLQNGVVRVTISREKFRLFDEVRLDRNGDGKFADDEVMVKAAPTDGPYWVNAAGADYRACRDKAPRVIVEEAGALRVTLRADAWLVDADGKRAGKTVTRITLCSGQNNVAVNHTFIVTWDTVPQEMRIRDMGVAVTPVTPLNSAQCTYRRWSKEFPLPEQGSLNLLADRSNRFFVRESKTNKILQSKFIRKDAWGTRMRGWFGGMGPRGGVALAQRNMFELCPKEIEVGRNALVWHGWPLHGTEAYEDDFDVTGFQNLRWLHEGKLLDFQIPQAYVEAMKRFKKLTPNRKWRWGGATKRQRGYGTGTAITGELAYFFVKPGKLDLDEAVGLFEQTPHAIADPAWMADARVLDGINSVQPQYALIEEGISAAFDRAMASLADNDEYGQFIWPNGHRYYQTGGSPLTFHRSRTNGHHGAQMAGWRLYLRSGESKYWHFARAKSRQLLNNGSINYHPYNPARDPKPLYTNMWPGAACHCDGYVPYGGYTELWGHMSPQSHSILFYYLTGDTQSLDMARMWGESALKKFRTSEDYDFKGAIGRNPANGWDMAVNYYVHFRDARALRLVGDFAERFFAQPMKHTTDVTPDSQGGAFWLYSYMEQWRDPHVKQLVVDWVHEFTRPGAPLTYRPVRQYDAKGKPIKVPFKKLGRSWSDPKCISGPGGWAHGGFYMTAGSEFSSNDAYVKSFWLDTLGLKQLREWADEPTQPYMSQEEFANLVPITEFIGSMARHGLPEVPCLYPVSAGARSYAVMREDTDREITLTLWGRIAKRPLKFEVLAPNGKRVATGEIPAGRRPSDEAVICKIAKDGQTGEYRFRLLTPLDWQLDRLVCPISDLPKEVYVVPPSATALTGVRYWWRTQQDEHKRVLTLQSKHSVSVLRLETPEGYLISKHAAKSARVAMSVKPDTLYRLTFQSFGSLKRHEYSPVRFKLESRSPMILSPSASRWFKPAGKTPR